MSQINKITLNAKEVAVLLDVSLNTIYRLCKEGQIPHKRIRNRLIFYRNSIEEWLQENQK